MFHTVCTIVTIRDIKKILWSNIIVQYILWFNNIIYCNTIYCKPALAINGQYRIK